MKKTIKVFLLTMSLLLFNFFTNSFSAYASDSPIMVEKEEYQEITDPYELLRLAIQQHKADITEYNYYIDNGCNGDIVVSQLIENKIFSDGSQESLYATTSFLILDENNRQVTMEQLLENNIEADLSGNITLSGGNYNLAVSCTAYWEWQRQNNSTWARCTHTTNQVVGNTSGQYWITQMDCVFKASNVIWTEEPDVDQIFIDYPTPYVMYAVSNPNPSFYLDAPYFSEIAAGVYITYNDGTTYQIYIDIKAAINNSLHH